MGLVWMENKISIGLLNEKGQSAVEYILLMTVLVVLAMGGVQQ